MQKSFHLHGFQSGAKYIGSHSGGRGTNGETHFFFFFFGLRNQREARILNTGESVVILEEKEAENKSLISVHNISN